MAGVQTLAKQCEKRFANAIEETIVAHDEVTCEIKAEQLTEVCQALRDEPDFAFDMLIDVCGVDYLHYGIDEWETEAVTSSGFNRGVDRTSGQNKASIWKKPRFAAVYHLLSLTHNHRLRLRAFLNDEPPQIKSVIDIWPAANWFEREAFDMYGILFEGHPDLRRILTDYGFQGHPFRKDFPVSGHVEMRYDAQQERVIYEPVDIQPRVLVPKVIRKDNRYEVTAEGAHSDE